MARTTCSYLQRSAAASSTRESAPSRRESAPCRTKEHSVRRATVRQRRLCSTPRIAPTRVPATREGAWMRALRDVRLDFANRLETWLTTNLPAVWKTVAHFPALHRRVKALLIDRAIRKIPTRPNPFSTRADYTSWRSLTDRSYDSRHLPWAAPSATAPEAAKVAGLLNREGEMTPCEKSTVLFPYFAEWFVDGFLRSERPHPDPETAKPVRDPARNETNHQIDLMQI